MTLDEYRIECAWSQAELARQSKLDVNTIRRALAGETISATSANKIARALSKELDRPIRANQIEDLNISL